jgi:hypothetical protein
LTGELKVVDVEENEDEDEEANICATSMAEMVKNSQKVYRLFTVS